MVFVTHILHQQEHGRFAQADQGINEVLPPRFARFCRPKLMNPLGDEVYHIA